MVPEPEDEAEAGGPGSAHRLPVGPGLPAASSALSAPRPERTAPSSPQRLLPAAAAAAQSRPASCRSAPPGPHGSTLLLSSVCLLTDVCLESRYILQCSLLKRGF